MIAQYVIAFREIFEAALIVGILLVYLSKTSQKDVMNKFWMGVASAVIASIAISIIVWAAFGELPEESMTLFEGIAAIIAVIILTTMILWMSFQGRHMQEELQSKVDRAILRGSSFGFFILAFIVVFREGFEIILFLLPFGATDAGGTVTGAVLGLITALAIAYAIFRFGVKIELRKLFYFTSILLILLAAGIFGHGIHELIDNQKAIGIDTGWFGAPAYDLGLPANSLFHDEGVIGSVLAALFGYASEMEWGRLILQIAYLAIFLPVTVLAYRRPELFDFLIWRKKGNSEKRAKEDDNEKGV